MSTPRFPEPTVTPVSQPFWDSTVEKRLMFQRCRDCRGAVFPPRKHCPRCWRHRLSWERSTGRGTVASWTVVRRPGHQAFAELAPYTLALVDLEEGFRMLTRLTGPGHSSVSVGAAVSLTWETQGETSLPLFSLSPSETT